MPECLRQGRIVFRLDLEDPLPAMADYFAGHAEQPVPHRAGTTLRPLRRQGIAQQYEPVPGRRTQVEIQFIGPEITARQPLGPQVQLQFLDPVFRTELPRIRS